MPHESLDLARGARRIPVTPLTPAQNSGAEFLRLVLWDLHRELGARGVPYAVLRGEQSFEELASGSDLHLIAREEQREEFERCVELACSRQGVRIYERFAAAHLAQYYLVACVDGHCAFFQIDLHTCEACFGVPFLELKDLLPEGEPTGIPLAREPHRAIVNFLGPFLSGGAAQASYVRPLQDELRESGARIVPILERIFGGPRAWDLAQALLVGTEAGLRAHLSALRRACMLHGFLRAPMRASKNAAAFAWGVRVRPWFRPRGKFVVFLGTDGSGKSTTIEATFSRLASVFSDRSTVFHLRPEAIPEISALLRFGRTTPTREDVARQHRSKPSGPIGSNLRVGYYWLDYWIGYWARILPRRRHHSLIVFDRYFYDFLVDPLRSRIRRGTYLAEKLSRFVPRPDVIIVCTARPAEIQARNPELAAEESLAQARAYEEFAATWPDCHLVHTDSTVLESVRQILWALFSAEPEG